jgi:poly(ADP-ribose) glycohydrolase
LLGSWGCGAFLGDKRLKFLIQWLAAAMSKKQISFYTFGDQKLAMELQKYYEGVSARKLTIKQLNELLITFNASEQEKGVSFEDFILKS